MSRGVEIWTRPWALAEVRRVRRRPLGPGAVAIPDDHRAGIWLFAPDGNSVSINGSAGSGEPVPGFDHTSASRTLVQAPLPLRRRAPVVVNLNGNDVALEWPALPERPPAKHIPQNDDEHAGHELFLRARSVWDRLRDVDSALADPSRLWEELRRRWTSDDHCEPQVDVIVRHAAHLRRTIDDLERAPRRFLRRTHRQVPLARVQEMDRRSMNWLVRQPGTSLAERAGDRQTILAVAREENFDTLENRVLRAYAELAAFVASNYLARHGAKRKSRRAELVSAYGVRCRKLSRDLAERGVRLVEPGVMPNFVLQQNPRYNKVWVAWQELISRDREDDELWRWQGRSWEEFCALAVMVALGDVPGAKLVASAPVSFRDEQQRGRWVDHDNPLGVFYLQEQGLVVEAHFALARPGPKRSDFAAPIWIRVGRTGAIDGFLSDIPVWPLWDHRGGLAREELAELASVLQLGRSARIAAGLVMRPAPPGADMEVETHGDVTALTIGVRGPALFEAIVALSGFFSSLVVDEKQP